MKKTSLSDEEDREWVKLFGFYKDKGCNDEEADEKTSKDMEELFPRLKEFEKWK